MWLELPRRCGVAGPQLSTYMWCPGQSEVHWCPCRTVPTLSDHRWFQVPGYSVGGTWHRRQTPLRTDLSLGGNTNRTQCEKYVSVNQSTDHTFRLVDKLVSGNPWWNRVPGDLEAGVPFIRNSKVPWSKHSRCRKDQAKQYLQFWISDIM